MTLEWGSTLGKVGDTLGDYLKFKEGVSTAKEVQPLIVESWQKMFIPVLVIGLIALIIWKKL